MVFWFAQLISFMQQVGSEFFNQYREREAVKGRNLLCKKVCCILRYDFILCGFGFCHIRFGFP